MNDKTQQVIELVNSGKFKKALPKLKKLNSKVATTTYTTLELEGVCLLKEKKYAMAEIVHSKALHKAPNAEAKCNTLLNLRTASFFQKNYDDTIEYIKKLLDIDGSYKYAEQRLQLCQLFFDSERFSNVIEYVSPLYALEEYFVKVLPIVISSYTSMNEYEQINRLLIKLKPELCTITSAQAMAIVNALNASETVDLMANLLFQLESRFGFEQWFKKSKLLLANKSEKPFENKEKAIITIPKERVVSDCSNAAQEIINLISLLEKSGAFFNPLLRFVNENGYLSIRSYDVKDCMNLQMRVPLNCMPLMTDFELAILDNQLRCKARERQLNPSAAPIMESLITLYNSTGKVKSWHDSYILFNLKDHPTLIDLLFKPLIRNRKLASYYELYENKDWQSLLLKSFFGAREFKYRNERLKSAGIITRNDSENGLLAIIDFLNHAHGQAVYEIPQRKAFMEINAKPEPECQEIFVQYSLLDPLRSYCIYGFVEQLSPFRFSLPGQFKLSNGIELTINLLPTYAPKEIVGEEIQLKDYFPASIQRKGKSISLSHLVIPAGSNLGALLDVIISVFKKCNVDGLFSDELSLNNMAREAEKVVIYFNQNYWQDVRRYYSERVLTDSQIAIDIKKELDKLIGLYESAISEYIKIHQLSVFK